MNKNEHVIDFIFPLSLFFVFLSSCIIVLILAFHVYKENVDLEQVNYESRTALMYIVQKIRQNDCSNTLSLCTKEKTNVLIIKDQSYITYIYEDQGYLKELFVQENMKFQKKDGKKIVPVSHLKMKQEHQLFTFSCIINHQQIETKISIKSNNEEVVS